MFSPWFSAGISFICCRGWWDKETRACVTGFRREPRQKSGHRHSSEPWSGSDGCWAVPRRTDPKKKERRAEEKYTVSVSLQVTQQRHFLDSYSRHAAKFLPRPSSLVTEPSLYIHCRKKQKIEEKKFLVDFTAYKAWQLTGNRNLIIRSWWVSWSGLRISATSCGTSLYRMKKKMQMWLVTSLCWVPRAKANVEPTFERR